MEVYVAPLSKSTLHEIVGVPLESKT